MSAVVRPYAPADEPAIRQLTAELWPVPIEREFFWACAPAGDHAWPRVWIAEQDGEICGFSRLDHNEFLASETLAYIVVNVKPAAKGQGIGRALAEQAERFARAQNQQTLRTSARSDLPRLTRFWQAWGFSEVLRGGPLLVWEEFNRPQQSGLRFETLEQFLQRPDAPALLEGPLNRWNRDIHLGLPYPPAGHISGEDWLDTVREIAASEFSFVAWEGEQLRALVTLYPWEGKADQLALNLDATLDTAFQDARPSVHLETVAHALNTAFANGIRRVVFEAQPHFPWAVQQFSSLGGQLVERPVWVVMDKSLTN